MADLAHADQVQEASPAYERDAYAWALHQARLIREGRFAEIDVANVAEEIESVGRGEKSELTNRVALVIQHLLKWKFQPARRGRSWVDTIDEQRARAADALRDNPSLRPAAPDIVARAYRLGMRAAVTETGMRKADFPVECPYTFAQIMDEDFLPD